MKKLNARGSFFAYCATTSVASKEPMNNGRGRENELRSTRDALGLLGADKLEPEPGNAMRCPK